MFKKYLSMISIVFFLSSSMTGELAVVKEITGLNLPESFLYDPASDSFFISNLGSSGGPSAKDNDGYITRFSGDFKKRIDEWIAGGDEISLNAPKGLAVYSGVLFVADIDRLLGFSIKTGNQVLEVNLKNMGAVFLNDVAADDVGNIYVTCTGSGKVFRYSIAKKTTDVWIDKGMIAAPNGIVFLPNDKSFIILDYADGIINKFDRVAKKISKTTTGFTSLDGVDYDLKGNLYFSSYTKGKVWVMDSGGSTRIVYEVDSSPADISIDRKHGYLLVPIMMDNKAVVLRMPND
jgi:sugar lactone lactonase YvrE